MTTQEARQLIGIRFKTRDERTGVEYDTSITDVKTPFGNTLIQVMSPHPRVWFKPNQEEQTQITNAIHEKNRQPAA